MITLTIEEQGTGEVKVYHLNWDDFQAVIEELEFAFPELQG